MEHFEKTLLSETIYDGKVIKLKKDKVQLENGKKTYREVFMHPGAVAVAALNDKNEVYMVSQYRYPIGQELLEIPAGKINEGEDPFECGKRELLEETGLIAKKYKSLGEIYTSAGFCNEKIYLFLAQGLSQAEQQLDEDEFLFVKKMPFASVLDMILANEIKDAKTQVAVLKIKAVLGL